MAVKKKEVAKISLVVSAGKANPAPPIGPALGQKGLNIGEFCKQFNDRTKDMEVGAPIPVEITAYSDRSFSFILKTPPTSYLVKKFANLEKGSKFPGREMAGTISMNNIKKIAEMKLGDMGVDEIDIAVKCVIGTASSVGIKVEE